MVNDNKSLETLGNPPDFEVALEQLQFTVKKLESGDLTLEQALQSFEEGIRLTRLCQQQLVSAEQRVEILMKATPEGEIETQSFSSSSNRS